MLPTGQQSRLGYGEEKEKREDVKVPRYCVYPAISTRGGSAKRFVFGCGQFALIAAWLVAIPLSSWGQIAGQTAAGGVYVLEDAEDLNLTAEALGRDWVSDFVFPSGFILSSLNLSGSGLTTAAGQSAAGALLASIPDDGAGSIDAGFGIPMPAVAGGSTASSPGNIASFSELDFLACFQQNNAGGAQFQVLLECYPRNPDMSFPTLLWNYSPSEGTAFQEVSIDLRSPGTILNNPGALPVDELLSRTRFLFFFFFANPVPLTAELNFHVDDIRLVPDPMPAGLIGGLDSADGPFTIDDIEDQDLTADPLGRIWVPDFVNSVAILSPLGLPGSGLSLAGGQSPAGAFQAVIPQSGFGSINSGFGVPMPGVVGASTAVSPGDVTSFGNLSFVACYEPAGLANQRFQVLLECYPENSDGSFPTVFWNYSPAPGTAFEQVIVDLASPDGVLDNPGDIQLVELLARTRFLFFHFFAGPVGEFAVLNFHIDDIELDGEPVVTTAVSHFIWARYE